MKKFSLFLVFVLCLTACTQVSATSIALPKREDIAPVVLDAPDSEADQTLAVTDLSLSMLAQLMEGENTMLSPCPLCLPLV